MLITGVIRAAEENTDLIRHNSNMELLKAGILEEYLDAAQTALWAGKADDASMLAGRSIRYQGDSPKARLILGQSALWVEGNALKALTHYQRYFALNGEKSLETLYQYASALRSSGRYEDAINRFKEALESPSTSSNEEKTQELRADTLGAIGNCYVKLQDYKLAELFFDYARDIGWPESDYLESKAQLLLQDQSQTITIFDKGEWREYPIGDSEEKAREMMEKAVHLSPENYWLKVNLAQSLWEDNKKEKAISLLREAAPQISSYYPNILLSQYLSDEEYHKVVFFEEMMKESFTNLDEALNKGAPKSRVDYMKGEIFAGIGSMEQAAACYSRALNNAEAQNGLILSISRRMIEYLPEKSPVLLKVIDKLKSHFKHSEYKLDTALRIMDAMIKSGDGSEETARYLLTLYSYMNDDDSRYEMLYAVSNLTDSKFEDTVGSELSVDFDNLRNTVMGNRQKVAEEKLRILNMHPVSDDVLIEKARLLVNIPRYGDAGDVYLKLADRAGKDKQLKLERKEKAYQYYLWGSERRKADNMLLDLYKSGSSNRTVLSQIVSNNWWEGNKSLATSALKLLRKHYPELPMTLEYSAREDMDRWNYKSAAVKLMTARAKRLENEESIEYVDKLLNDAIIESRPSLETTHYRTNDSTLSNEWITRSELRLPQNGWKAIGMIQHGRIYKERMTRNQIKLISKYREYGGGLEIPVHNGYLRFILSRPSYITDLNPEYSDFATEAMMRTRVKNFTWTFENTRRPMADTPISLELGIVERTTSLSYYYEMNRWVSLGSVESAELTDGNSRNAHNISLGFRPWSRFVTIKTNYSFNSMEREFDISHVSTLNIDTSEIRDWEVYYAPEGSRSRSVALEYSRDFDVFAFSLSFARGISTKATGRKSNTKSLSGEFSLPVKTGEFSYSFYGSRSEVPPISPDDTPSKYVGREHTLTYLHRF